MYRESTCYKHEGWGVVRMKSWTGRDSNPHDFARYGRMDFHLDFYLSPDFRKLRLRPGGMLIVPPALS